MDINTSTLQRQAAAITPLKPDNSRRSVDSTVNGAADASQQAEVRPVFASASVDQAKVAKESDDLKQAVSTLNDFVQNMQRTLQFSLDKQSGVMVVKVVDAKSEKVIRQIPSEEAIKLARSVAEQSDDAVFNIFSSRA
jgi:flagellar protein FlaG